jgi:2-dehydro-3-deoxygluconokinase
MTSTQVEAVTIGETMALLSSEGTGPLMRNAAMRLSMGGAECNVAIGLRRLGVASAWVGRIGDDLLGDVIEREIAAEGVVGLIRRDPGRPTGLMIKARRTVEHSSVAYYRRESAGAGLSPDDIPADVVANAALLHVTGITPALSDSAAAAVDHAIDIARAAGVTVSLDFNFRSRLWSREAARAAYLALLPRVDVVFAGEEEAAIAVEPAGLEETVAALLQLGPTEVVIKRGRSGAVGRSTGDDQAVHMPAIPVSVVDSVGAGDAFVAGYLAARHHGADVTGRLDAAVRAGALACLTVGDWEGMPRSSELSLFDSADPVVR